MVPVPQNMENNTESDPAKAKKRKANTDNSEAKKPCLENGDQIFSSTRFKFLLRSQLTAQQALETFVEYADMYPKAPNNVDIVSEYCELSDEGNEVLTLLNALRLQPSMIVSIFNVLRSILIRVADNLVTYKKLAYNIAQKLLGVYMQKIYQMLGSSQKSKAVKSSLKLLTAIVILGENSARNVLNKFDFSNLGLIKGLLERRNVLDEQDIRTCFLHFLMSFLMTGSNTIIHEFVCKHDVISKIFVGLRVDKLSVIELVLPIILDKVVMNELITKSEKVKVFSSEVLSHLARVYNWLGPKEWKKAHKKVLDFQVIEESPALENVRKTVHNLILELCTSPKNGIIFFDKTFGTSGRDQNHTIRLFLQDVHVMPFFEDSCLKELIVKIFQVCPEQMQPFLIQVQNATAPRASLRWLQCMDFLENILETLPDIPLPLKTSRKIPMEKLLELVQSVVMPPQEILQPIVASIGYKELLIRHRCLQYTLKLMKKLNGIIQYCTNGSFLAESKVFTKADVEIFTGLFMDHITRRLPTVKTIFNSWQEMNKETSDKQSAAAVAEKMESDLPEVDSVDHVILIEQTLCLYQTLWPKAFSDVPIIGEVFDQVQTLCQTWKNQPSTAAAAAVDSEELDKEKSYQQTRVRLYLLKLFAGTDARKIPWNKKNADGQPLLYFLLDMLLITSNDQRLLSIIKQLICQLLYHSGLFHSQEMELHLWMDWLIKFGQEDSREGGGSRNEELLKFVANIFTQYICNPYPYMEKVFELLSEASVIEMGSDNCGDIVSTSTIDDFIDRINELDDEELGLNEHPTEQNDKENPIKLAFSPLIIVAMKETTQKSDEEIEPLKNYLQSVLIDLFHSQTNPIPLGILVTEEKKVRKDCWISKRIVSYIKLWLPNSKVSKKEKSIDVEEYKNERSSVLLQLFHQNGSSVIDNSEFVTLLFASVNNLNASETLRAAQQSLRYIQARLLQVEQSGSLGDQDLSILQLIFKYVKKVFKHLFQKCQQQASSNDSVSEDFQILQTETFSAERILCEILSFLSQQTAIQHWFLAIEPDFAKDSVPIEKDTWNLLRNVVTKELTAVFSEIPKTSNKILFNCYCTKIKAYLKECLVLVSRGQLADDISLVSMVLKHIIPYIDFTTIQESIELLLQLPPEVLTSKTNTSDSGHLLIKLLSYLIRNCKTFLLEVKSLNNIYTLLLHSESIDKLLTVCQTLFEARPYYCLSCPSNIFVHLLTTDTSEHLNLAMILLTYNVALDPVFVQWVLDKDDLKHSIEKFLNICITWCKCQKTLPTDKSKKCLAKISKVSRKYLCARLSDDDTESSDSSANLQEACLQLLQQFARLQAPGYKHMPSLESFKEIVDSKQTMSPQKLKLFLALIHWADSINDQSVNTACCLIDVCLKTFLSSIQLRAGAAEDKELESKLLTYLEKYLIDLPPEYNELLLSNWTSFIRSSLRIYYSDCRVLRLVGHLIPKVYTDSNRETITPDLKDLHQMLIGHSNFLPVIMGSESKVSKELLVDILLAVIEREPECCAERHLFVLMGAYEASLSTCDQKLLKMIYLYEKNGVDFSKLRPYLWGVKAIEMYELSKQETTLDRLPSTDRVFEIIDPDKMIKSILHFPVKRTLSPLNIAPAEQWKSIESCYDPCFLLPVLSHLLASCNQLRSLHFMMKNCLGYTFTALSSHDSEMRAAGYHILTRLEEHLKASSFQRKEQYLHLLYFLQNSITTENTKVPFVNAIYMTRMGQILLNEGHLLYASITAPLVVKPCQELNLIPEFFRLFSSASLQHYHERMWILYLLHDGLRDSHDYRIYKKYYIFKIIMSFANSILCNYTSQFQILRILKRACEQKTGAYDLTRHSGIVSWINTFISRVDPHSPAIILLTEVVHTLWFSLLRKNRTEQEGEVDKNSLDLPLPFIQEMQVVLLNLLQNYREGTSYAGMKFFLPLFASVLLYKEKSFEKQLDKKGEEKTNKVEETDEKTIKTNNPATSHLLKLELTPRDVLLVIYQSRHHSSNVQIGEKSLNLMKLWGYTCDHLTEVSFSLQKQTAEKSEPEENIPTELSDITYPEEETTTTTTTCSNKEQNKMQQALVDICLTWIPLKGFRQADKNESCFDETLELVMTCLCEEAANMTSLCSILKVLHWIKTHLNHSDSAIDAAISLNKSQGNLPVLFESLLSLYTKLVSMSDTEQNTVGSASLTDTQKPLVDALHVLSNICRTLSEKWSLEDSNKSKSDASHVLKSFLKQIAVEFQT